MDRRSLRIERGRQLRAFAALPTPKALTGLLIGGLAARIAAGKLGWADVAVIGATVVGYSPGEWVAHKYVLHSGEFTVGSAPRQLGIARNHAAHHADPTNTDKSVLDSTRNLSVAILGGTAALTVPMRVLGGRSTSAAALTAGTSMIAAILWYETHHYLIHAGYSGSSAAFRRRRKVHLAHHYRDEDRFFGVGSTWCDRVLGTS